MKVLFISTSDITGGAAIAAFRLFMALKDSGMQVKLLAKEKKSDVAEVTPVIDSFAKKFSAQLLHYFEKLQLLGKIDNRKNLFFFSTGDYGYDISKHPLVQEADIIHYHWINHTFLSIKNLEQLAATGKPIISHLHDMWAFTGGCHYAGTCSNFMNHCGNCNYLSNHNSKDLSFQINSSKEKLYSHSNIFFITSSISLMNIAKSSSLLKNKSVTAIPIPINQNIYKHEDTDAARKKLSIPVGKKIILFGVHNISDERKGFKYLVEAINILTDKDVNFKANTEVVLFGKTKVNLQDYFKIKVNYIGVLNLQQIVSAYSASDIYVLPSLEDNLPNTVLESLSCKVPVVAFNTGGIPEMIEHKMNGYLSDYQSSESLAEGIDWVIKNNPKAYLNQDLYSNESVVKKMVEYYSTILKQKK